MSIPITLHHVSNIIIRGIRLETETSKNGNTMAYYPVSQEQRSKGKRGITDDITILPYNSVQFKQTSLYNLASDLEIYGQQANDVFLSMFNKTSNNKILWI